MVAASTRSRLKVPRLAVIAGEPHSLRFKKTLIADALLNFLVEPLKIPEVVVVRPRRFGDARGWFMETYRQDAYQQLGIAVTFIQDNQAFSQTAGTLRGLHFQAPPNAQAKLVRVVRGAIFDVAVDIRRGSPSYGSWAGARLSAEGGEQLFVPPGFAHGYCTLEADTEVAYKCDAYYAPESEGGINASDSALAIAWPFEPEAMTLSAKDQTLPPFRDFDSPFRFDPNVAQAGAR
jgi:dTDP-4-dehydrorhamnose 3,5-epimerase